MQTSLAANPLNYLMIDALARAGAPAESPVELGGPFVVSAVVPIIRSSDHRTRYSQSTMQVIHYPHPTLRHASQPLRRVDESLRASVSRMVELMYEHRGVGLAANQVDLPYRLFVMNPTGDPAEADQEQVFINPVLSRPKGSQIGEEGCLSIPRVNGDVVRAERITIQGFNLQGEEFHAEVEGFFARIVQHETDHLDGRLFIDRLGPAALAQVRPELEELELEFHSKQQTGEFPSDEQILAQLAELERQRCAT